MLRPALDSSAYGSPEAFPSIRTQFDISLPSCLCHDHSRKGPEAAGVAEAVAARVLECRFLVAYHQLDSPCHSAPINQRHHRCSSRRRSKLKRLPNGWRLTVSCTLDGDASRALQRRRSFHLRQRGVSNSAGAIARSSYLRPPRVALPAPRTWP